MSKIINVVCNLQTKVNISGAVNIPEKITIHDKFPDFEGSYTVTPKVGEQVLDTKNKSLTDDIAIGAISYVEVTNPQGGKTATIGTI